MPMGILAPARRVAPGRLVVDHGCVYFAYVDETGTDARSPAMVMAGIVVNGERLTRTQDDLSEITATLDGITTGHLKELKSKTLFAGSGAWGGVPGPERRKVVSNLCGWLCDRKHDLALAAIGKERLAAHAPAAPELANIWQAGACHIALQLQRAHQSKSGNKGRTVLVFDDNKWETANFSDLVYSPPAWTDDYYHRPQQKPPLYEMIDTPFAVKSHHVGLVQVADIFAAIFRRYAELTEFARPEKYPGELAHYQEWVSVLSPRLLGRAHRWPRRPKSACARWYCSVAPTSLLALD
jgi:hypothetical protein